MNETVHGVFFFLPGTPSGIRPPDTIRSAATLTGGAEGLITNDQGLVRMEPRLTIWLRWPG